MRQLNDVRDTMERRIKKLGLIINPIAGMGGKVGLKGTDGTDMLRQARALGAVPEAPGKAGQALEKLLPLRDVLTVVTCETNMGETVARQLGFTVDVVYKAGDGVKKEGGQAKQLTTADDTKAAAVAIAGHGVDLLLFAGGDGTARDVYEAIGTKQIALGIPAGVKIHSPVYANSPGQAGRLALLYLAGESTAAGERDVVDVDEKAVRQDVLQTSLYGYLQVPVDAAFMQNSKSPTLATEAGEQRDIAAYVVDTMEDDVCYIVGPGTTTRQIMQALGLPFTLLGVDVIMNGRLLGRDVAERELLRYASEHRCRVVVTPVGGQGYVLGRGNQQISGAVMKQIGKTGLMVVATRDKLMALQGKPLLVDTGDPTVDAMLAGYCRVTTGYGMETMHRIRGG